MALVGSAEAQSLDVSYPSRVSSNEVVGTIDARDLGDARLTDHFYALIGTPGDLIFTIESKNLNGDIDVFAAAGLRPLLKFTLYAESSAAISKSIYLRKREDLILRVEARTPNDDPGTYHVRFGGSFELLPAEPLMAERQNDAEKSASDNRAVNKTGRRVSSVGARIPEPAPTPATEVAAQPPSEGTAEPAAAVTPKKRTVAAAPKRSTTKNARTTKPSNRKSAPASAPAAGEPETAKVETEKPESEEVPSTVSRRTGRKTANRRTPVTKPAEPSAEPESGPRLLIETKNGTLIDRFMSTVRRVMVENGQVVVVGNDNKVDRIRLSDVVKMTIAP